MALPGADPIAAALAAGETPSPEMVAASQEKEGFSSRTAIALFVAIALLLLPTTWSLHRVGLHTKARIDIPPEALADRVQLLLSGLGYPETPRYRNYGFDCCDARNFKDVVGLGQQRGTEVLATHQPAVMRFWYRQHRDPIVARANFVSYDEPANDQPGMGRLALDAKGRLIALEMRPDAEVSSRTSIPDDTKLFDATGLERARFQTVVPRTVPPMAFDKQMAWVGTYRDDLPDAVRVEAAWWQGRPVYLNITGNQHRPDERHDALPAALPFVNAITAVLAILGAVLAGPYNLRAGRGDRRGAAFVAWGMFLIGVGAYILQGRFAASFSAFANVMLWLAVITTGSVFIWMAYIAIEPFVRRQTPDALISWTRFYSGHLRDPLVAAHILVGVGVMLVNSLIANLIMQFGAKVWIIALPANSVRALESPAAFAFGLLDTLVGATLMTFQFLLLTLVFRAIVRRQWIADVIACAVMGALGLYAYTGAVGFVMNAIFMFVLLMLLRRFGFLSMLSAFWTIVVLESVPFSLDAWYTGRVVVTLALPLLVSAWALWVILTDRRTAVEVAS
jgi:serine/threonine-protein kinase